MDANEKIQMAIERVLTSECKVEEAQKRFVAATDKLKESNREVKAVYREADRTIHAVHGSQKRRFTYNGFLWLFDGTELQKSGTVIEL